jgi:hypothetical protein
MRPPDAQAVRLQVDMDARAAVGAAAALERRSDMHGDDAVLASAIADPTEAHGLGLELRGERAARPPLRCLARLVHGDLLASILANPASTESGQAQATTWAPTYFSSQPIRATKLSPPGDDGK